MDIVDVWNCIIEIGYTTRKNKCNGLEMWQPLKNLYSKYIFEELDNTEGKNIEAKNKEKINIADTYTSLIKKVNYSGPDEDGKHENVTVKIGETTVNNKVETEHFIVQHFRLPITENYILSPVKLLQIAYNIGQAKAEFEQKTYPDDIVEFYNKNKLNDISTYIQNTRLTLVKKTISGGYFKRKYMKYKEKYLSTK